MSYTNISKPTGANYLNANPVGKQLYDDTNAEYDDSVTLYDGSELNAYTNINKPEGIEFIIRGMITGLLIPLTYTKDYIAGVNLYTKISKPT